MDKSKFAVSTYNKIADAYTKQYFNDLTDLPYIDKFLLKLPASAKILDIGCGPGTFTQYLQQKGFEVEGIDLSEEMIKIAKEKVPGVTFRLMDMRKLEYPDNSFGGLLVAYSLIHIPSEEIPSTLLGFKKVLKTGGYMMIIAQGGEPDKIVDEPLKEGEKIRTENPNLTGLTSLDALSQKLGGYKIEPIFKNHPNDELGYFYKIKLPKITDLKKAQADFEKLDVVINIPFFALCPCNAPANF